ncbi:MAG: 1-acyl-sn-glycerol-3-phosphate acyltransferase [Deltaproteobacteria bacterium]|nr:1-acyl-sn-glycerol-3-phosphate acyltransferase [Deltaproteobacteria bacterium]
MLTTGPATCASSGPAIPRTEPTGYDVFGLHLPEVERVARWSRFAFERYFRVDASGHEHVPLVGPAILVSNHSGMLPVDATMLWLDVFRRTGRVVRTIADRFVPRLPFVSTLFSRVGVVSGSRPNVRWLLEHGELVAIFPEGTTGPGKSMAQHYHLQDWRVGHVEFAIRHRVPIIPIAIIGAEESWPLLARIPHVHLFGAPYLPLPVSLVPLPVRFHIHYGAPIRFDDPPASADDPEVLARAAAITRGAVERLIAHGLIARDQGRGQ